MTLNDQREFDRRRAEFDAEFARAGRFHRRFMVVLAVVAVPVEIVVSAGVVGLVAWVLTGHHMLEAK